MGEGRFMFVSGVVAFGITLGLLPLTGRCLRHLHVFDHPSVRSFHDRPTVRGAGVAVAVGALVALSLSSSVTRGDRVALACTAVLFAVIGLVEDLHGIDARRRLALQAVATATVLPLLVATGPAWPLWALVLLPFWLVAFVNAFNFMDGINGISCATATVAGATWWAVGRYEDVSLVAVAGVIIVAAALGFIPFNFPTARLFLGDVGSYFIGAWLAVVVVIGLHQGIPAEAVVAPLVLYLADTGTTLARRVVRGELWYEPHSEHTYQRLMHGGWSHGVTSIFVAACTLVISGLGALSLSGSLALRIAGDVGVIGMVSGYLVSPRTAAALRLHRTVLVR